jgi:protein gp37
MGEHSKIEWTDHTFNPFIGCQKVGPGCDFCYAEDMMDKRYGRVQWGPHGDRVRTSAANWKKPLAWNRAAAAAGERHRVFCASLADWADTHKSIPHTWREDLGDLIEATPNLDWLLLTKRIGNADEVLGEMFTFQVPSNVWIGITVVTQAEADRDIPKLMELASNRKITKTFLSMEPLLGFVRIAPWLHDSDCRMITTAYEECSCSEPREVRVDWVIAGGESGPNARPMHPDWARSLRDQCAAAGVPFLFKQWGEWLPWEPEQAPFWMAQNGRSEDSHRLFPDIDNAPNWDDGLGYVADGCSHAAFQRVGKKAAGRLLDGKEHNGYPATPSKEAA